MPSGAEVSDFERDVVDGTVVTSGGAPTKTLREAAEQLRQATLERIFSALGIPVTILLDFSARVDQTPAAAIYGLPELARVGKSEDDCTADGIPHEIGRCELAAAPRGLIAGQGGRAHRIGAGPDSR